MVVSNCVPQALQMRRSSLPTMAVLKAVKWCCNVNERRVSTSYLYKASDEAKGAQTETYKLKMM